jgi:polysaccharide export outer membrane protein
MVYFQDFDSYLKTVQSEVLSAYDVTIKPDDQLLITVNAPVMEQTQVAQFNLPSATYLSIGELSTTQSPTLQTYLVDQEGCINFPVVGKIRLAGLTRAQAMELITQKVSAYLPDPIINFQMISARVTMLGEISRVGAVGIRDGRLTILEAIGAAGDLTIYGDRRNVLLFREHNGEMVYHRFDLTQADIFNSPYFYLQQNDVIYVVPNKTRRLDGHFGQADSYRMSVISVIVGVVSVIASSVITIISLSKTK